MTWNLPAFQDKEVVFIGRGREGQSFEKFINEHGHIKSFRFVDQQDDPQYLDKLKDLDLNQTVVVKTAGCPGYLVPVPYTTPTNVFFELISQTQAMTIGITATKGKSTVASLLAHLLISSGKKAILCGNIGLPMIDYLDQAADDAIFVIELGAYQTADLTRSPHICLITNLYNDHVPYFNNSLETYWEAKHNLIAHAASDDYFVYNPAFPKLQQWAQMAACQTLAIDLNAPIDISKSKLFGQHNEFNARAARTAARLLDVTDEQAQTAIDTFPGVPHRLEIVGTVNGRTYVDDAIGTQPEATIEGLKAVTEHVGPVGCILLGGEDRHYEFGELVNTLSKLQVPNLVLFPDTGQQIKDTLPVNYSPHILETKDMNEAVSWAAEHAPTGSVVLLSTASPSYTLWKDFEAKGEAFQQAIKQLG